MKWVQIIPYVDFKKVKLGNFLPGQEISRTESCYECILGYSGCEEAVGVTFAWREDQVDEIGQIDLFFRDGVQSNCSPELASRVMKAIKLPLEPKSSKDFIFSILGEPQSTRVCPEDVVSYSFYCYGNPDERYELHCLIHSQKGLCGIVIVRTDAMLV